MERPNSPPRHLLIAVFGIGSAIILGLLLLKSDITARLSGDDEPPVIISTGTIKSGDVLANVLLKHVAPVYVGKIEAAFSKTGFDLRKIQPDHLYEVVTSTDG